MDIFHLSLKLRSVSVDSYKINVINDDIIYKTKINDQYNMFIGDYTELF